MLASPRSFFAKFPHNQLSPLPRQSVSGLALLVLLTIFPAAAAAATHYVPAGGNFQAAINAAQPGDTIVLEAGATFVGPFTLPNKGAGDDRWITIQSSRAAELPEGVRVSPASAHVMPKLVSVGFGDVALKAGWGAHHYRLLGIEITRVSPGAFVYDLLQLGNGTWEQSSLDSVPHHLVIDRCYIHGDSGDLKRGIALNSAHTDILNSYISDIHVRGQEAQAIGGWNGTGPFRIINNYLEGAGENFMLGGATGGLSAQGVVPADIEIRRNHMRKPLEWRGQWTVKNLLEIKSARRVVIDGNLFENNWTDGQSGVAILFTPRPNDSGPGAVVEDVEFTNNIIRNIGAGITLLGKDDLYTADPNSVRLRRVRIANNFFDGIDGVLHNSFGTFLLMLNGTDSVKAENNTAMGGTAVIRTSHGSPHTNFVFRDNLTPHGHTGISGDSAGTGNGAIAAYYPNGLFVGNILIGTGPPPFGPFYDPTQWYPAGNHFPRINAEVGFVDAAGGDYRLAAHSPYRGAGAGGRDLGCDFAQLQAAQGGGNITPLPTPTPNPTPTPVSTPQLSGYLDVAGCSSIVGWAWDSARPNTPISVDVFADNNLIATLAADYFRQDLVAAGMGDGRHGFVLPTPAALRDQLPHLISVRFSGTTSELHMSRQTLSCAAGPTPTPTPVPTPAPQLLGYHDETNCDVIRGWAWDSMRPNTPISVDIYADDEFVVTVLANEFRPDLPAAGIGDGRHGFAVSTPEIIRDRGFHLIRVRIAGTNIDLRNTLMPLSCDNERRPTAAAAGQLSANSDGHSSEVAPKWNEGSLNQSIPVWNLRLALSGRNAKLEVMPPVSAGASDDESSWFINWDGRAGNSMVWQSLTAALFKLRYS